MQRKAFELKFGPHAHGNRLRGNSGEYAAIVAQLAYYPDVGCDAVDEAVAVDVDANHVSAIEIVSRAYLNLSRDYSVAARILRIGDIADVSA